MPVYYSSQRMHSKKFILSFFSPKTAILGHIPGTGLHFDIKYEEVSLPEHNLRELLQPCLIFFLFFSSGCWV